jgi:hypothetical protein
MLLIILGNEIDLPQAADRSNSRPHARPLPTVIAAQFPWNFGLF